MLREVVMVLSGIWFQLRMIAPYWAVGLTVGSLVSVYLSRRISGRMEALRAKGLNLPQLCLASLLGMASPLCMFGTVPVIAVLGRKGLPQHLLAAFMISSVLLNPNLLILTFVLGRGLVLARLISCFVAGVLAGLLAYSLFAGKEIFSLERFETDDGAKKKKFLPDLLKAFKITAPYLLIGVTLTALVDRYIPPVWIYSMFGARQGLGVLFATTLSVPLYACGGGVIPLINAWLHAGMGQGDALAFMLGGPATKINSLSAVKMILGTKNFLLYLAYCLTFAALAGLAFGLMS